MLSVLQRLRSWAQLDEPMHPLDRAFSSVSRKSLFAHGWGDEQFLNESFSAGMPLASRVDAPSVAWGVAQADRHLLFTDGSFTSPRTDLPPEALRARVRRIHAQAARARRACIVLSGSRDETYGLRTQLFAPLAREGVDLFLLENPFYGHRRPVGQRGAWLRTVYEHILMNIATVEEARALVAHAFDAGYERVSIAGYSMGGYMAALAASVTRESVGVGVLAAGASPAPVFSRGAHARSIDFERLGEGSNATHARARIAELFDAARITRLPPLSAPDKAVIVACERDGFVPLQEAHALHAHWAGSRLRTVNAGHISALFTERAVLRNAVRDTLG